MNYQVQWSDEDGEFVATCEEYPNLSGLGKTKAEALQELEIAVAGWLSYRAGASLKAPGVVSLALFSDTLTHASRVTADGGMRPLCGANVQHVSAGGDSNFVCDSCIPLMLAELGVAPEEVDTLVAEMKLLVEDS